MKRTQRQNKELELILNFLGINFIDYQSKRISNGHITAKTLGEIKSYFGREVMTTGQFIDDIDWWDFENNWNDLFFYVFYFYFFYLSRLFLFSFFLFLFFSCNITI